MLETTSRYMDIVEQVKNHHVGRAVYEDCRDHHTVEQIDSGFAFEVAPGLWACQESYEATVCDRCCLVDGVRSSECYDDHNHDTGRAYDWCPVLYRLATPLEKIDVNAEVSRIYDSDIPPGRWFVEPDGADGWCVMRVPAKPEHVGDQYKVASFISRGEAEHVVALRSILIGSPNSGLSERLRCAVCPAYPSIGQLGFF